MIELMIVECRGRNGEYLARRYDVQTYLKELRAS